MCKVLNTNIIVYVVTPDTNTLFLNIVINNEDNETIIHISNPIYDNPNIK